MPEPEVKWYVDDREVGEGREFVSHMSAALRGKFSIHIEFKVTFTYAVTYAVTYMVTYPVTIHIHGHLPSRKNA